MVVEPKSQELSAGILYERALVQPTNDLKSLLWYSKRGTIDWVVGTGDYTDLNGVSHGFQSN